MTKHRHNGLQPGAAFGELGADGVPEPVGADGRSAGRVEQASSGAGGLEGQVEQVGWPGAFQPRAPADPGVTVSRYRALVILITRQTGRKEPIPSARTGAGLAGRSRANTGRPSSSPAAACTSCGSTAPGRR